MKQSKGWLEINVGGNGAVVLPANTPIKCYVIRSRMTKICKKCGKTSLDNTSKYCGDGSDKDNDHSWVTKMPREEKLRVWDIFASNHCLCGNEKESHFWVCQPCWENYLLGTKEAALADAACSEHLSAIKVILSKIPKTEVLKMHETVAAGKHIIEETVPNFDGMNQIDIEEWLTNHPYNEKTAKKLFGDQDFQIDQIAVLLTIREYASYKNEAMKRRAKGYIGSAMECEEACDRIYNRIPKSLRW